jgi:hypothetical protein
MQAKQKFKAWNGWDAKDSQSDAFQKPLFETRGPWGYADGMILRYFVQKSQG